MNPTTIRLRTIVSSGSTPDPSDLDAIRAAIFGQLVALAAPIVEHYRSDLYHDAGWLGRNVNGPTTFFFAVRDSGTEIGNDRDLVAYITHAGLWSITLTNNDGRWDLTILPL